MKCWQSLSRFVVAMGLVGAGPAAAQPAPGGMLGSPSPEAKQKAIVERKVQATPIQKKEGPTAAEKAKKEFAGKRRPSVNKFDDPMDRNRALIEAKQKQIEERRQLLLGKLKNIYDRVLGQGGDPAKEADLLHRMAELRWGSAKYHYFQKRFAYEQAMEDYLAQKRSDKPDEPKPDYTKALEIYRKILRDHPNYARIDEVIFYLGDGLRLVGKDGDAAPYFQKIRNHHKTSKFMADSLLGLAEYFFKSDLLFAARDTYKEIVEKYPQTRSYNYALYKLGWTYYNLGGMEPASFRNAIDTFKAVIGGLDAMKAPEKATIEFREQALKDLVIAFAAVKDGAKECRDYFTQRGGDKLAVQMLDRLAKFYLAHDKDEEAIAIFRWFIEREPQSPQVLEWSETILESIKKIGKPERIESEMLAIVEKFGPKGQWAAANASNADLSKKARAFAESSLEYLASHNHQEAQRLRQDALYKKAATFYKMFIEAFPDSPKAYRSRFYLAEITYLKLDKPDEAATYYHDVVKVGPGEFLVDAAYGRISCYHKLMKADRARTQTGGAFDYAKIGKGRKGAIEKRPIPKWEQLFVEASDAYVKIVQKPDDTVPVMYNAAEIYFYNHHYDDAVKRYAYIVDNFPQHPFALFAANNILESYNRLSDWKQIELWARRLRDNPKFKARSKKELNKFIALSIFNRANEMKDANDNQGAAGELLRLQAELPKSELSDEALFSAASLYSRGKKHDLAIETFKKLLAAYPKSPKAKETTFLIGAIYDSLADFPSAAEYFELRTKFKDKKSDEAKNALYNAALIRHALGETTRAIELYETYIKRFPKAEETRGLYWRIADIYEQAGEWTKAIAVYRRFRQRFKNSAKAVNATLRIGLALRRLKKTRQADKEIAAAAKMGKRFLETADAKTKPLVAAWVAHATYLEAVDEYNEYLALKIRLPTNMKPRRAANVMKKDMEKKAEGLKRVTDAFEAILGYKNANRSTCAMWRIGLTYQEFSKSLMEAPVPKGLTPDEEQVYKIKLQERALPIEEKAFAAFAQALKLGSEQNVFNTCVQKAGEALATARPEEFPSVKEDSVRPSHSVESWQPTPVVVDLKPAPAAAKPTANSATQAGGNAHAKR
jgi:TolA-binding protein